MPRKKKQETDPILSAIAPPGDVAPQHQIKDYQAGWNYTRAEEQRQVIATTKPHLYRKCSLRKLAEKMSKVPPKNGLYSNILEPATLEGVDFSAITADIKQLAAIKNTKVSKT
ncbi:MAG: hypothetical protein ICV78_12380 [Tolypothrix sp. Co-bin9]|nr:hypothetical protein [Tolypothrix sp. Co-bin9]